ncbi:MAG: peptide deformylase [Desulfobacterales bacterium]|nr:peptide deformylase [Desulfobacterales bacterium]
MAVKEILLLGNPKLYNVSVPVAQDQLDHIKSVVKDLHDTMMDFRNTYGVGRAIAAPQIDVMQRLIYMYIDKPVVFINPELDQKSDEMITVWDDCMCFPDLLVQVQRHKTCRIIYRDMDWCEQKMDLQDDLSELLQHEYDHLDGILAVSRAIDSRSFALRNQLLD